MKRSNMMKYRQVQCPKCFAVEGQPCLTEGNSRPTQPHQARIKRWRDDTEAHRAR